MTGTEGSSEASFFGKKMVLLLFLLGFPLAGANSLQPFTGGDVDSQPSDNNERWEQDLWDKAGEDTVPRGDTDWQGKQLAMRDFLLLIAIILILWWLVQPQRFLRVLCRRPHTRLHVCVAAPGLSPVRVPLWQSPYCPRYLELGLGEEIIQMGLSLGCLPLYPLLRLPFGWMTVTHSQDRSPVYLKVSKRVSLWTAFLIYRRLRDSNYRLTFFWEHEDAFYRVQPSSGSPGEGPPHPESPSRYRGSPDPPVDSMEAAGPVVWLDLTPQGVRYRCTDHEV